ncbi:hypothetical protein C4901_07145 [Acidiferrobacter sp. SPIII_3]|nr:hypothetical protein C4901_07145 [Acidiferrobacter sp. SPIII_3]
MNAPWRRAARQRWVRDTRPRRMISVPLLRTGMRRHEAKSLCLVRAVFEKVVQAPDPRVPITAVLMWARHFAAQHPNDIWLARWIPLLEGALDGGDADLERLYEVMLDPSAHGIDMRQSSPWAGVLTVRERTAVLLDFQKRWAHDHGRTSA